MSVASEEPVVTYDVQRGEFVAPDGTIVTDAQRKKADAILERGLLRLTHRAFEHGVRVDEYACEPLPGCKRAYTIRHARQLENGTGRVTAQSWTCECQASRGTTHAAPRRCSHELALILFTSRASAGQREVSEESEA